MTAWRRSSIWMRNATWHDGEPVTAEDWVFTAQLITDPDFPFGLKSEFNSWAGTTDAGIEESENSVMVEALDDYTLKMTFKTVTPVEDWLPSAQQVLLRTSGTPSGRPLPRRT